jgi:excisionase family DNA binding protein
LVFGRAFDGQTGGRPACRQAGILRISRQEVYRLVARRRIPYIRFSIRGIRFRVEDFEEWLRSKTITPALGRDKD